MASLFISFAALHQCQPIGVGPEGGREGGQTPATLQGKKVHAARHVRCNIARKEGWQCMQCMAAVDTIKIDAENWFAGGETGPVNYFTLPVTRLVFF